MSTTPFTENCNATTVIAAGTAFYIHSDDDDDDDDDEVDNKNIVSSNDTLPTGKKCTATTISSTEEEKETPMLEERVMQEEVEQTKYHKDNMVDEQECCYEQGISTELNSAVNNNNNNSDVVELTPELTLANVPVFDGRVELPNAASIGGHHLSLTEGRIFMKQSCSKREERFYELVRSYQQELVERAMAHASSVIHQYLQKGMPDALEHSFNMYIQREHRQKYQHEQKQQEQSNEKIVNNNNNNDDDDVDVDVCKAREKNQEHRRSNSSNNICKRGSTAVDEGNEVEKRKLTSGLLKTVSGVRASNVSMNELNKCGSGQSVVNGSFNSVSLYDNSTLGESEDNVLAKESVKENIKDSAEETRQRREKKMAATLWWTIMAYEYQNNEENRESTLSDIGAINSGNNNAEPIEFLSSTPTDLNVLGNVDGTKEEEEEEWWFERHSSAACGCGHFSTHSSANAIAREDHNNPNINENSTTSSLIRTWEQNNVIDDGHYETTYEVQRQVMNNGSFASNITSNTNTCSNRAMCFRSPTTKLPQAMRSPSVNSHKTAMFDVQSAHPNTMVTSQAMEKEGPLQGSDNDGMNHTCNTSMRSNQETPINIKTQDTMNIHYSNDNDKLTDNGECMALADSRGKNAPQDECASVITTYSSVSTRPTAVEIEKARALHWLAPFIPRFFGIRKVRLSTITELGVPRACLNGWSVDSKDIAERVEEVAAAVSGKVNSKDNEKISNSTSANLERKGKSGDNVCVDTLNVDNNKAKGVEKQTASSPLANKEQECDELLTEHKYKGKKIHKNKSEKYKNNGSLSSNDSSRKSSALRATRRKKTPLRFRFSISSISQSTRKKGVTGSNYNNSSSNKNKRLNEPYCEMIAMEDVCYHFAHPCVLDMKMGSRQYGLHPTATKKKSKEKKSLQSTSAKYGIRLAGYRRWNEQTQTYDKKSKLDCRYLTLAELKKELFTFFQESRQMEHMFRKQVENLRVVFSKQTIFRFYTSSLLFVYDADDPLKTGRIVMVDFAYTYEKDELIQDNDPEASFAYDVGYLKALDTLLSLLA